MTKIAMKEWPSIAKNSVKYSASITDSCDIFNEKPV